MKPPSPLTSNLCYCGPVSVAARSVFPEGGRATATGGLDAFAAVPLPDHERLGKRESERQTVRSLLSVHAIYQVARPREQGMKMPS